MNLEPLSNIKRAGLFLLSFLVVAFGQPTWSWWFGLIAAIIGYALFWRILLDIPKRSHRFLLATAWFAFVQFVHLSWANSHPYLYIYLVYPLFSIAMGTQLGLLAIFITPKRVNSFRGILAIAGFWTLLEWLRLFFLSGYSWNPAGIALSGSIYTLQMASLWGVYGLSFWVMFVNLLALRAWYRGFSPMALGIWVAAAGLPYVYGAIHLKIHTHAMTFQQSPEFHAVLVQTNFPAVLEYGSKKKVILQAMEDWKKILQTTQKQKGLSIDLMVLPEYAVPCGTYTCIYPYEVVSKAFNEILGPESVKTLPPLEEPFVQSLQTENGSLYLVNNAFWAQGLANFFHSGVVIGLEDVDEVAPGKREHYSAAVYFRPDIPASAMSFDIQRYEKRVLVPLGEYVPFSLFNTLLAEYGIQGSFTSGKEAKVFFAGDKLPFGLSICYEETFGHLMRENKQCGAALLVNLTSDAWYPNSSLPHQHMSHAILRTVEGGIPLIRASNLGLTGAVDSLGRVVAMLGEGEKQPDSLLDSLRVRVPTYTYSTIYSHFGDSLIVGFSFIASLFSFSRKSWWSD